MIWLYKKIYNEFKINPDKAWNSLASLAQKVGIDTGHIAKLKKEMIGRKIQDLGLVERRKYHAKIVEYSAFLSQAGTGEQLILRIVDKIHDKRYFDFFMAADFTVLYCPIRKNACERIIDSIGQSEEGFLKKPSMPAPRNFLVKELGFWGVKRHGTIDEINRVIIPRRGRVFHWYQKIDAYTANEKEEVVFILRIQSKLKEEGNPPIFNYSLYYPFGRNGVRSLRRMLGAYLK